MDRLKEQMIGEVLAAGGKPVGKKSSLYDCFTFDHDLGHLMLWYNMGLTTKMIFRDYSPAAADPLPLRKAQRHSVVSHSGH